MPLAKANGIELCYETIGDPAAPPLLLVMGLAGQMILWDRRLCEQLAALGRQVIRFDNRDVGESTQMDGDMGPLMPQLQAAMMGQPVSAPYSLDDMAEDALGLLDALGKKTADVVGASMGGMIAQTMAIRSPGRVRTLTSIMSTTGHPSLPPPRPEAMGALLSPVSRDREAVIENVVRIYRVIGSPGYPFDEQRVRDYGARAFERGFHPAGVMRQLLAILSSGHRREKLKALRVPSLVLHGQDDPLIPIEGGRDTAASIPGARILEFAGMGHDLPEALWPSFVDAIGQHIAG